jgi:uncharacterized cupredoxin-like copper-binding protein
MPNSRTMWAIIVAVLVVIAAVAGFFLLSPTGPREVILTMQEFGFNGYQGGPTIKVKVGESLRVILENKGGADHEFMIVKDLQGIREALHRTVQELRDKGMDQEAIEKSEELEMLHHKYAAVELIVEGKEEHDVEIEPGESKLITLTFHEPGTYYYVCAELAITFPESHIVKGMYGTIIVEG